MCARCRRSRPSATSGCSWPLGSWCSRVGCCPRCRGWTSCGAGSGTWRRGSLGSGPSGLLQLPVVGAYQQGLGFFGPLEASAWSGAVGGDLLALAMLVGGLAMAVGPPGVLRCWVARARNIATAGAVVAFVSPSGAAATRGALCALSSWSLATERLPARRCGSCWLVVLPDWRPQPACRLCCRRLRAAAEDARPLLDPRRRPARPGWSPPAARCLAWRIIGSWDGLVGTTRTAGC